MANPKDRAAAVARKLVRVRREAEGFGFSLLVAGRQISDGPFADQLEAEGEEFIKRLAAALRKCGIR